MNERRSGVPSTSTLFEFFFPYAVQLDAVSSDENENRSNKTMQHLCVYRYFWTEIPSYFTTTLNTE